MNLFYKTCHSNKLEAYLSLFTLLIVFTGTVFSQSGWVRQYPPAQAQNISFLSVSFVNADTGFIVGSYGTILHTTNGGTNWVIQSSGTINWLRGVSASGPNTATAVGDSGIILHTTNGGAVWEPQSSGTVHNLRALSFIDADTGTVVGDSGIILHTTNGGAKWKSQSSGTVNNLRGVSFPNSNIGTAVGDSGTILRTINGGTKWTSQPILYEDQKKDALYGVSFADADTGNAVGYTSFVDNITPSNGPGGIIINTIDGGTTWDRLGNPYVSTIFSGLPMFGVSLTDANTGTFVGLNAIGDVGIIWRTMDGGGDWINQSFGNNGFYGVCFTDSITGTVVGDNGTIFHTTTGGVTGIIDNSAKSLPGQFALEQNYPNPFNPTTNISYSLPRNGFVTLKVFDILGREVRTLVNERQSTGNHSVTFDASDLASGVYFYRLIARPMGTHSVGNFVDAKKLVLLK